MKVYRVFLWIGLIFSAICLLASFFIKPPVDAGQFDTFLFRTSAVIMFGISTLAFVLKLFCRKSVFAIKKAGREFAYWAVVCVASVAVSYPLSFAHTEGYQKDYAAYMEAQEAAKEAAKETEPAATEEEVLMTTEAPTEPATEAPTPAETLPETEAPTQAPTEPPTEPPAEPTMAPDALIDSSGYTYYFDDTVEFEDFDVKVNRLKIAQTVGDDYYYVMVDYTVYNKTDSELSFRLYRTGNIFGDFRFHGYERYLGGNDNINDDEFSETGDFRRNNAHTLGAQDSVNHFYCGVVEKRPLEDPKDGMRLRIDDEMEFDLYFLVDDVYHIVTLEVN